jgi:hypothetical protein
MSETSIPWFERWPELLGWELGRFAARGIEVSIDERRRDQGQLVMHCDRTFRGESVPIEARFPSEYPELPPLIFGPPGLMKRHQHRFGGNFCLLGRPLDDWPAATWGAADLIGERLEALIADTEAGPRAVAAAEEPMPEPVGAYFATANDASVLIAEEVRPQGESGRLQIRRPAPHVFIVDGEGGRRLNADLLGLLAGGEQFEASWVRLPEAPAVGPDGGAVARWLRGAHPGLLAPDLPPKLRGSRRLQGAPTEELVGLVFPEEGPGVGEFHDGYLFLYVDRRGGAKRELLLDGRILSGEELARRRPELTGLENNRVAVLGLGTLGADIAVELAKAGVGQLELIDFDTLEAGNLMRHRLGIEYVGLPKARAVAIAARRANPYCQTTATEVHLGAVDWDGKSPLEELEAAVKAADLIVEASGTHQLAQLTGRLSAETETPMISAWLTEGFWGAEVARLRPGRSMCWHCFATAQQDGRLPRAPSGPPSQVSAQGCSHPTTAGAGFDALEAAAIAARLVVQTLEPEGGYPDSDWDHAILSFRATVGDDRPRFFGQRLQPREGCDRCRTSVGSSLTP